MGACSWGRYRWLVAGGLVACQVFSSADAAVRSRVAEVGGGKPARVTAPLPPRRPAGLTPIARPDPAKTNPAAKTISDPKTMSAVKTAPAPQPERPAGPSVCLVTFTERGGIALPPAADSGSGDCAIDDPITFKSVATPDGSKVELDSAVTVDCDFALEVVGWIRDDLPGILASEKATLAKLTGVGGHACRPRNGVAGAPISEHASGNALDLLGLRFQDGRTIALTGREAGTKSLRDALQKSVCARFTTVLGPGSDASHKDHLHLDMRKRSRDFKICQWTVE